MDNNKSLAEMMTQTKPTIGEIIDELRSDNKKLREYIADLQGIIVTLVHDRDAYIEQVKEHQATIIILDGMIQEMGENG